MPADQQVARSRRSGGLSLSFQRVFMRAHIALYRLSNGALGSRFGKRNFMLLTTIGRKSGQERVTPIFYVPVVEDAMRVEEGPTDAMGTDAINRVPTEKGRFLLIASNWGVPTDPAWWLNLQASPRAQARIGRKTIAVTARKAGAEERARLWPLITSRYANFADYQRRNTREIPIVILTPTE